MLLSGSAKGAEQPPGWPAPRVLIVEDDPQVRSLLTEYVRDLGLETDEAGDGVEALARARRITRLSCCLMSRCRTWAERNFSLM
jgi:DNA-binding NtrC family response regulator